MHSVRRAVIDIGTNSVKMLIADIDGRNVIPLSEKSEQTRLGAGFYETHRLQPDAIQRTAEAVARFASEALQMKPERIRVIATSAARDAINQSELLTTVTGASGLPVEIISGEEEADLAFRGVTGAFPAQPLLILDVGGGSSEFILGEGTVQYFRHSFRLGSVRLLETLQVSDPPQSVQWQECETWLNNFIEKQIGPGLETALERCHGQTVELVGTGGTATILARVKLGMNSFDRDRIEATRLSSDQVWEQINQFWALPLAQRKEIVGLPPNRADVILTGAAIFGTIMRRFHFTHLKVCTRGLRFAAVL